MGEVISRVQNRKRRELSRVKRYYSALEQRGGKRVSVQLEAGHLKAIEEMAEAFEPIATTIRRIVLEEAQKRSLL